MQVFQLAYQRPLSPASTEFAGIPDPLMGRPSLAVTELATKCGLKQYTLEGRDEPGPGWNAGAFLYIHPANLSDEEFNCLSDQVRPPYHTLSKVERCRRVVERNLAAPECPQVLY